MLTTHNIDIQAMLVWLALPFYDFCGFWSVAVNTVYKLQFFFTFMTYIPEDQYLVWRHLIKVGVTSAARRQPNDNNSESSARVF